MRYVLIALGAIGDVGRPDFVGVFAERYLSFKSTFERALSARAYFGFFKIAAHCPTPCSCTPASNAAFSASVHLRLPCLCACGLKTTDFANGDNGGVSPGLCVLVFVGVVDARHLSFKSTFERAASARPNSGSFKIILQRPYEIIERARRSRQSPVPYSRASSPPRARFASSSRPVPVPYFPTPSASASFSSSVQNAFFLRVLFLLFCAFGRPRRSRRQSFVRDSPSSSSPTRGFVGVRVLAHRRLPRRHRLHVHQRVFPRVHPRLDVFLRHRAVRRRIRAARCVVVVADSVATRDGPPRDGLIERARASIDDVDSKRSTTRRSIQKSIDDASMYFSTTRHRSTTDRPTAGRDAVDSNRSIVDRRRDGATRRRRLTSRRPTIDDRRLDDATRSRAGATRRTRGDDDDDDDDDDGRSMGIIGRARATDALERRPRATRERVARRAGGVMVRAMRWRRAREDANAFDGSTRARRARESRMRRFGWTDRTRTRRDERGDAMMGRARAFDETMD